MPKFAPAGQDAFLAHAGLNKPAQLKPAPPVGATLEPSLLSSPSVTSREGHRAPLVPPKVRPPQPAKIAESAVIQAQPQVQRNVAEEKNITPRSDLASKENQPQTLQNGEIGLSGSRWASTGPVTFVTRTPSVIAAPPSPKLLSNTLATSGRTVLRENMVKVTKGRDVVTRGIARLVKNNPEDRYFTIELEIEGKLVLDKEVLDNDHLRYNSTIVTYRAERVNDGSAPMPSTTWSIKFQMPYQAASFYNLIICNLTTRNNQPQSKACPQPSTNPATAACNRATSPVEKLDAVKSSDLVYDQIQQPNIPETSPLTALEHPLAFDINGQVNQQHTSAFGGGLQNIAASTAESGLASISESCPISEPETVIHSRSQRIPSSDWPFQPISDPFAAGLLDRYQPGGGHRISSQAFTDMTEVAGFEPLISFDNDELEPRPPWVQQFLDLDDTELVQTTFDYFQKLPEGSFLDQLSNIVDKDNVPPASQLTGAEILSSQNYQEAAENLVGGRLCHSETFAQLPDMVSIHYTTEKARKILKKAVALHESQSVNTNLVTCQSSQVIKQDWNEDGDSQYHNQTANSDRLEQSSMTKTSVNLKANASRITYSAKDLLGLQKHAAEFNIDMVSREVARLIKPAELTTALEFRPINPANVVGPTRNSFPIVAGRGNLAGPDFKPTTTVGAWQAYSAAESGVEPSIPNETQQDVPTLNERRKSQANPISIQQEAVLRASSSNNSKTSAPVKNEPVLSSGKPADPSQAQGTDMVLWGALLTSVKSKKQDPSRIRALSNSAKPQTPQVSSRGSRHVPTNSDCDRLAKTFEGLNLSHEPKEQPSTPKPQLMAASDVYKTYSQPYVNDQPRPASASSLAMTEEIKEALKSPLSLLSCPSPKTTTPQPIKSDVSASIPPTPTLTSAKSMSTLEVKTETSRTAQVSTEVHPTPVLAPMNPSRLEPRIKVESPGIAISSANALPGELEPAPPTPELESNSVNNPPKVPTPENAQDPALKVKTENLTTKIAAPAPQIPEKALPLLENITNKDLKGAPGLSASKWASGSADQEFISKAQPSGGCPPSMLPMTAFAPILPIYNPYNHTYTPQLAIGNVLASPPPITPTIASTSPTLQTVLVPDPFRPGRFMEVTGIPASKLPTPMPSMMSPPRKQENNPYALQNSPASNFAPRPDMYHGHKSNDSSGSDLNLMPGGSPFQPSRGRGDSAGTPQSRTALSPVRQGEDVQAKLQSRLNTSLAGRSPNARR
jgi:hypothetical protein